MPPHPPRGAAGPQRHPARLTLVAVATLMTAAPVGAAPVPPPVVQDGTPSPAACLALGFDLSSPPARPPVLRSRPPHPAPLAPPPPPPPPPPPVTLPIEAAKKEDRLEYAGPPATANDVVVSGSRIGPYRPGLPPPPRPVDTERYPDATPNAVKRTADQPISTFSIDVDTAAYANVRRFINQGRTPPRDAVRVEEMVNYFDYGYARPTSAAQPFAVTATTTASPWSEGRRIVHIALQGYELPENQRRPLNLTFLVDVSGSMNRPDKLELAKQSMNLIIDRLRPQDHVAVAYYAEGAGTTLAPTAGTEKLKLRCAVASLRASGGTAGATGMTNAYDQAQASFGRDKVNRILMFTDGDFNVGVTDDKRLEDYVADKRKTGIYLSVYGFGRGNYQDARMQTIAQAGNGTAAYVDDLKEARRLFGPMFDRGAFPIADDVKIQVEFNPARIAEWRLIGYETRLLNEEDFSNDAVDAGEVGSGASVTALYEITPVGGPTQIPERRYADNRVSTRGGDPHGELGFIQVRYKQPGQQRSELIQQPLSDRSRAGAPPEATRWALAVAAFGQKLRGDPWMATDYGWDRVLGLAQGARGADPYGERAEFVQLVRAAQNLPEGREP